MTESNGKVGKQSLNPIALSLDQVARVLGVKLEVIHNHVERGAPTASDGTMSLVHYAAWLNQQLSKAGS